MGKRQRQQHQRESLDQWKQATWEFLLEHCDYLDSGAMFIKFHTQGRENLEKRIYARLRYKYHREDVVAKEERITTRRDAFEKERREKKERYDREKARRKNQGKKKETWWQKVLHRFM